MWDRYQSSLCTASGPSVNYHPPARPSSLTILSIGPPPLEHIYLQADDLETSTYMTHHSYTVVLTSYEAFSGNRPIMRQHVHHCHYNLLLLLLCAEQISSATSLSGFCRPSHPGAVHQVGPLGIESLCHFNLELPKSPQYASPSASILPRSLIK